MKTFQKFINESYDSSIKGKIIVQMLDKGDGMLTVYAACKAGGFDDAVKYMEENDNHGDWSKINKITLAQKILNAHK